MQARAKSVTLRPATVDDQAFLLQVYASTRSEELDQWGWNDEQKQAFVIMQFNAQTQHYRACYPAAESGIILLEDQPIGRMMVDQAGDEVLLVDIAILSEHRNLGVGTRLIQDLLQEAAKQLKPVRLHVLTASNAVRLYERLGFSIKGGDDPYLEMVWFPVTSGS